MAAGGGKRKTRRGSKGGKQLKQGRSGDSQEMLRKITAKQRGQGTDQGRPHPGSFELFGRLLVDVPTNNQQQKKGDSRKGGKADKATRSHQREREKRADNTTAKQETKTKTNRDQEFSELKDQAHGKLGTKRKQDILRKEC